MNSIYKKLAIVLVTTTSITLPPAQAEIPFTQALGVYQNTKEDKKHLSPFWGFVALHGKMLETIRFFGNYSKNIMEEPDEDGVMVRHEADVPNDKIAALIKRLFNSPDGVQFVATDYEGDPVGNLSRNLPKINDIIKILVEGKDKKSKVGQITTILDNLIPGIEEIRGVLSKIEAIKADQENENFRKESEFVLAEFNSILEKYKNDYDPKKLVNIVSRNLSSASNSIDEEIQKRLTQKEMEIENKIRQLSVEEIKNLAHQEGIPFTNDMPKGVRNTFIKIIHSQAHIPLESLNTYTDQQLRDFAAEKKIDFKETWQEKLVEELTQKIVKKELADNKDNNIKGILKEISSEYNLDFDGTKKTTDNLKILKKQLETLQRERTVPNLSPISLVSIAIETFEKDNSTLANLLVDAYEAQGKLANPVELPNEYLYPENIVVTALLAFFVKVANDKTELNALPFLMDEPFKENTAFTKEQYFQNKQYVNQIIQDSQNNPEPAFLMAKGFEAFDSPLSQPVNYLGSTPYQEQVFPDCGETSLRNVLAIFLSATNGGVISEKALDSLKQKIKFPTNMPLENSPLSKMMSYFSSHRDVTSAASVKNHTDWAEVVSDLNQGQVPTTLNDVQYGRPNDKGVNTFEIKSNFDINVKGIVNMFNVIAKLIPDEVLNERWSDYRELRFQQISKKLDQFCELLSWSNLKLSWENKNTKDNTIDNEFLNIVFKNNDAPIFEWRFVPGHFQLDPVVTAKNDWRINFQSAPENTFSNEWMASLFLKADEDKWLQNGSYGRIFPLSLIYTNNLLSTDGALKILSFVLYENMENKFFTQIQPLILRWIERTIPLNDRYSLQKISLLLYSCNNMTTIQNTLTRREFNPIKDEVNRLMLLEKTNPNEIINSAAWILNTVLYLVSKRPGQWTSLQLYGNDTITDAGLANLTNLMNVDLSDNDKITDNWVRNLKNLTSLNLSDNHTITDNGILSLPNLRSLDLRRNKTITNEAILKLRERGVKIIRF